MAFNHTQTVQGDTNRDTTNPLEHGVIWSRGLDGGSSQICLLRRFVHGCEGKRGLFELMA